VPWEVRTERGLNVAFQPGPRLGDGRLLERFTTLNDLNTLSRWAEAMRAAAPRV